MGYYTWDTYDCCIATGVGQLTAWRNADVKLATAECIAADTFVSASIQHPQKNTTRMGYLGSFVMGRYGSGYTDGYVRAEHKLQTCQFGYWLKQSCTTTENTPAGYNTHALTINESTTPLSFGYHLESTLASNNLYWDFLGLIPTRRLISCSERQTEARQILEFQYAYLQASGDSITKTKRAEGTTGSITKEWSHAVTGGLGAGQSVLTYNTGSTECDIIGFEIDETRGGTMRTRDANGYATVGIMKEHDWRVRLEVVPTGDALFTLSRTEAEDYAGDLDLAFSLTADATNDKITYTFDKLYLVPFDREMDYNKYTESYFITLEPYSEDSTFTETGIDSLDNDHYENP